MTAATGRQQIADRRPGPERVGVLHVHLILRRGDEILLGQRHRTADGDGWWHLPTAPTGLGGDVKHAAAQAGRHQLGIGVVRSGLRLGFLLWDHTGTVIFLHASRWVGAPTNRAPDRYIGWAWFPLADTADLTTPTIAFALSQYAAGHQYGQTPPRTPTPRTGNHHPIGR